MIMRIRDPRPDDLLTVQEVAEILGKDESTIRRAILDGRLSATTPTGKEWRILRRDVYGILAERAFGNCCQHCGRA